MSRVGLVVCTLVACSCGRRTAMMTPAGGWALAVDERVAIDPRAEPLMQWVVPLKTDGTTVCSATEIAQHALLTAAHCVDGGEPPIVDLAGTPEVIRALDHRGCGDRSCGDPFPVRQYEHFREDLATLWVDDAVPAADFPMLARVRGDVRGAFMLSARTEHAHPLCRARVGQDDVGHVLGDVQKGDSGSAIVAVRPDGNAAVLGVVVERIDTAGHEWFFAALADSVPWPEAARGNPPPVEQFDEADFDNIEDCN